MYTYVRLVLFLFPHSSQSCRFLVLGQPWLRVHHDEPLLLDSHIARLQASIAVVQNSLGKAEGARSLVMEILY